MDILNFKITGYSYEPKKGVALLTIDAADGDSEIRIQITNPTRNALHNCMAAYDSRYSEDSITIRLEGNHEL